LLFTALTAMAEIPALYAQRPIVQRHKNAALYHPFVEALALTLVDVPVVFTTSISFGIIIYFMAGLQRSAVSRPKVIILLLLTYDGSGSILVRRVLLWRNMLHANF
jgi:ATP-binding cassette subfamily G (WHITE) protein 2 (SNQ2)